MASIGPQTIRAKLTILTMLVMGALLGVFGVIVDVGVNKTLIKGIDDELLAHATHMPPIGGRHGPMGFGRGPDGPDRAPMGFGHGPSNPGQSKTANATSTIDPMLKVFALSLLDDGGPRAFDGPAPQAGQVGKSVDTPTTKSGPTAPGIVSSSTQTAQGQTDAKSSSPTTGSASTTNTGSQELPPRFWIVQPRGPGQWPSPDQNQHPYDLEDFALAKVGHSPPIKTVLIGSLPYRVITVPIFDDQHKVYAVSQITAPLSETYKTLAGLRYTLLTMVIPSGVVLSGLASLYLVGRFMSPLRLISKNADAIGASNPAERLPVVGEDEFALLATTLNGMLARLEDGLRLEQDTNRRLEATVLMQRRFTEDASHELKTPLAVIKANTGLMLHFGGTAEENRDSILTIDTAADRMNKMVQDLLILARAESGHLTPRFEPIEVSTILEDSLGHLVGAKERVSIESPAGPCIVKASPDHLSRVFVNLIDNALRHSETGCPVEIRIGTKDGQIVTTVRDHGVGIAPEHLERLFDRFYRIDKSRSSDTGGTGLGLAICKGIVEAHGGRIEVSSIVGEGTSFAVILPQFSA